MGVEEVRVALEAAARARPVPEPEVEPSRR